MSNLEKKQKLSPSSPSLVQTIHFPTLHSTIDLAPNPEGDALVVVTQDQIYKVPITEGRESIVLPYELPKNSTLSTKLNMHPTTKRLILHRADNLRKGALLVTSLSELENDSIPFEIPVDTPPLGFASMFNGNIIVAFGRSNPKYPAQLVLLDPAGRLLRTHDFLGPKNVPYVAGGCNVPYVSEGDHPGLITVLHGSFGSRRSVFDLNLTQPLINRERCAEIMQLKTDFQGQICICKYKRPSLIQRFDANQWKTGKLKTPKSVVDITQVVCDAELVDDFYPLPNHKNVYSAYGDGVTLGLNLMIVWFSFLSMLFCLFSMNWCFIKKP